MPGKQVIITKGLTKQESIKECLPSLNETDEILKEGDTVLLKIDLSLPEGYPSITDPNLIQYVIEYCLERNVSKILIGSCSLYDIDSEYCWYSLGLSYLTEHEKVEFVALDKVKEKSQRALENRAVEVPEILKIVDCMITLVNPKLDPVFDLQLTAHNNGYLYPFSQHKLVKAITVDCCEEDAYLRYISEFLKQISQIKAPDIVILDLTTIIDIAGPEIMADTQFTASDIVILSNSTVLADMTALAICGIDYMKNPLINAMLEDFQRADLLNALNSAVFVEKDAGGTINKIEVSEEYKKFIKANNPDDGFKFPKISLQKLPKLEKIFPEFVNLHLGTLHSGTKEALYKIIFLLKSALIKDRENMDQIQILAGINPPETEIKENIIVFGDCAITSTMNHNFRIIEKKSEVTPEGELEKDRIQYQADLREELLEWETQMEQTKENIENQFEEEEKKEKALQSLKDQDKKKRNKWDKKYQKFVEKQEKKQKKEIKKSKEVKIKKNKNILEIKGNPPVLYDYIPLILDFFGAKNLPLLNLWNANIQRYHDNAEYLEEYKEWSKLRKKEMKEIMEERKS